MPTLNFKGKAVIETYHHTVPHHRLEFDDKLSLLPKGEKPSLDGNLIIEGDNLLALKALLPTHAGKIKCVYIDPPYNTGNEGWVYNDNLTQPQFKEWIGKTVGKEGEDATRHDKWCCMMYPRLQLLKELMRDDGVIFVSLDDTELHNLRSLLDEVFGLENRVATIIWKGATDNNPTRIAVEHENIVCYAKTLEKTDAVWNQPNPPAKLFMLKEFAAIKSKHASLAEQRRLFRDFIRKNREQCAPLTHYDRIDDRGPYTGSRKVHNPGKEGYRYDVIHPVTKRPCKMPARGYRYPWETMKPLIDAKKIIYGQDENQIIQIKEYLEDYEGTLKSVIVLDSRAAANSLEAIFGNRETFKGPKPVELIKELVGFVTGPGDLILDSFAGSGTTGEAVLNLNVGPTEPRRFILVQMPYDTNEQKAAAHNICRTITSERVRRVASGYDRKRTDRAGKSKVDHMRGFGGSFSYVNVGDPLFGEYRDLGDKLPRFEELAKYIFYTETSRECDLKKIDEKTGFIGSTTAAGGTSYYLLYTPNNKEDRELSTETLKALLQKDKNRTWVIYCEKIWLHGDTLRKFEKDNGKRVRPMLVPFNLK